MSESTHSGSNAATPNKPFFNIDAILGSSSGTEALKELYKPKPRGASGPFLMKPLVRSGSGRQNFAPLARGNHSQPTLQSVSTQENPAPAPAEPKNLPGPQNAPALGQARKFTPLMKPKGGRVSFRALTQGGGASAQNSNGNIGSSPPSTQAANTEVQNRLVINHLSVANTVIGESGGTEMPSMRAPPMSATETPVSAPSPRAPKIASAPHPALSRIMPQPVPDALASPAGESYVPTLQRLNTPKILASRLKANRPMSPKAPSIPSIGHPKAMIQVADPTKPELSSSAQTFSSAELPRPPSTRSAEGSMNNIIQKQSSVRREVKPLLTIENHLSQATQERPDFALPSSTGPSSRQSGAQPTTYPPPSGAHVESQVMHVGVPPTPAVKMRMPEQNEPVNPGWGGLHRGPTPPPMPSRLRRPSSVRGRPASMGRPQFHGPQTEQLEAQNMDVMDKYPSEQNVPGEGDRTSNGSIPLRDETAVEHITQPVNDFCPMQPANYEGLMADSIQARSMATDHTHIPIRGTGASWSSGLEAARQPTNQPQISATGQDTARHEMQPLQTTVSSMQRSPSLGSPNVRAMPNIRRPQRKMSFNGTMSNAPLSRTHVRSSSTSSTASPVSEGQQQDVMHVAPTPNQPTTLPMKLTDGPTPTRMEHDVGPITQTHPARRVEEQSHFRLEPSTIAPVGQPQLRQQAVEGQRLRRGPVPTMPVPQSHPARLEQSDGLRGSAPTRPIAQPDFTRQAVEHAHLRRGSFPVASIAQFSPQQDRPTSRTAPVPVAPIVRTQPMPQAIEESPLRNGPVTITTAYRTPPATPVSQPDVHEYASTDYHDTREKEKMVPALYTPRSPKRTAPGTDEYTREESYQTVHSRGARAGPEIAETPTPHHQQTAAVPQNPFAPSDMRSRQHFMAAGRQAHTSATSALAKHNQLPSLAPADTRDWKAICAKIVRESEEATHMALQNIDQDEQETLRQQMEMDEIDKTLRLLRVEMVDQRARILDITSDLLSLLHRENTNRDRDHQGKKRKIQAKDPQQVETVEAPRPQSVVDPLEETSLTAASASGSNEIELDASSPTSAAADDNIELDHKDSGNNVPAAETGSFPDATKAEHVADDTHGQVGKGISDENMMDTDKPVEPHQETVCNDLEEMVQVEGARPEEAASDTMDVDQPISIDSGDEMDAGGGDSDAESVDLS